MKTQLYRRAAFGLTLALLPFVGGCEAGEGELGPSLVTAAIAEPVVQATNTAALAQTPAPAENSGETPATPKPEFTEPVPAKPAPAGELTLPPSIKPSSPLAEIVKLAQSGVDEGVLLTYITNSSHTFGLGADEIVYLNDLGLPSEVITRIMEHDKAMKQFWAAQAQTQQAAAPAPEAAPAEQTAVAPSYENPPQAEPMPAEPQPSNVTYNYFYDTLSPYGSWVNVDGYGMCWQPSTAVVNPGWQPYRDGGRWVYTDAGWYWYSDYTWGWAPFHYGRWFSHSNYGWCWYPGYTWGPSWVSWRYTDGYCGWAPLPPAAHYSSGIGFTYYGSSVGVSFGFGLGYDCYTFVPWDRFCNYRPARYCAPKQHCQQIYSRSTVVNNVINGNNNTIINNGVPLGRVTAATKGDIQKVALRDMSGTTGRGARRERFDGDGRTLAVHRPRPAHNSLAPTTAGRGGARQDRNVPSGRPEIVRQPTNDGIKPSSVTARPAQKEGRTPVGGRTTFAVETPTARPATPSPNTRNSPVTPEAPRTTASTAPPRAKSIDLPSTTPVPTPTRTRATDASAAGRRTPERSTVPPLIMRGSERMSEPAPARPTVPQPSAPSRKEQTPTPSSLVVIGKRENSSSQRQGIVISPQPQSRAAETASPEVSARSERQNSSRPDSPQRTFSQSEASSPSVTRNVQPQNTPRSSSPAPVQRPSAPAPSYTPRPSAPSPAPQISRPAPTPAPAPAPAARPQPSQPAVSAPTRSASPPPASRPQPSAPSGNSRQSSRNN